MTERPADAEETTLNGVIACLEERAVAVLVDLALGERSSGSGMLLNLGAVLGCDGRSQRDRSRSEERSRGCEVSACS